MNPAIHLLPTPEDLSKALASKVAELAGQAGREGRRFTVALSGGSLMEILSRSLVSEPLRSAIDWTAWEAFWADERCVSLDSPDSNFAAAKKLLFDQVDIPRDQIHALDDRLEPAEAARAYQSTIKRILQPQNGQLPRFDLILLGMGEDGHTASLFPGHRLLQEVQQWAAPVFDAPKAPAERITLTLPVINQAREVIFVVTGENKASALQAVFQAEGGGQRLPAAMVSPINGTLRWFLDSAAGKNLAF